LKNKLSGTRYLHRPTFSDGARLMARIFGADEPALSAFEAMREGVVLINRNYEIIFSNDAFRRMAETGKSDPRGRHIGEFLDGVNEGSFTFDYSGVGSAEQASTRKLTISSPADDRSLICNCIAVGSGTGGFEGGILFCIDEAGMQLRERRIKDLESLNRSIMDTIPAGVIAIDSNLRILFANKTFMVLSGMFSPDLLGEHITDILPFSMLREKLLLLQILEVLDKGGARSITDLRFMINDDERIVNLRIRSLRQEGANSNLALLVFDDVTSMFNMHKQLEHAQRMKSIGRLAGGVAHDFNNLLGGILGYAMMLKKTTRLDNEKEHYIDSIIKSSERAKGLTDQLLTMASGGHPPAGVFSPASVIGEVVALLSRTIDKSISIETQIAGDAASVLGNETNFQQAILNLCINARDAMPRGGKIEIDVENTELDDSFCSKYIEATPGMYVTIRISDNGIGIDPKIIDRVFDPFFTTKKKEGGTGLGLSIVYGSIKSMGGFTRVESAQGSGTTFTLYLPASKREKESEQAPAETAVRGGDETVLVVDDEAVMRDLTCDILESAGYRTLKAIDGLHALEVFSRERSRIDLVVIDLIMPNMSGREAFRRLREISPDIPVLVYTGFSSDGQADEIMACKSTNLLKKPFSVDEMLVKVRESLDGR